MDNLLAYIGSPTNLVLSWPAWVAAAGILLSCLLALYAILLLLTGDQHPSRVWLPQPATLRGRMNLGFILIATLPAISISILLLAQTAEERLEHTADAVRAQSRNMVWVADQFLSNNPSDLTGLARQLQSNHTAEFRTITNRGFGTILLDHQRRVLFASESAELPALVKLSRSSDPTADQVPDDGQAFYFAQAPTGGDAAQRYIATVQSLKNGWRIFLYRSLEDFELVALKQAGIAMAWLVAAIVIALCMAIALTNGITRSLQELSRSVHSYDLSTAPDQVELTAGSPKEVRTIFENLGTLDKRIRSTFRKLRKALKQGEKLRGELIYVIANREKEIEQRTKELKEANETLRRLSREDKLTGLANRRWFAEFLGRTWQGAQREKKPVSILIIDIDNFKAYNDTYGHQRGDWCLKLIAKAIREIVGRSSDLVSRYGGEEFVVVLGDTPLDGALQIGERIRAAVENLAIPHETSKGHASVTVSIGATSTLPTQDTQPEPFLVAADRAMYMAKREGKNQVAYSTGASTGVFQALCLPNNPETRLF